MKKTIALFSLVFVFQYLHAQEVQTNLPIPSIICEHSSNMEECWEVVRSTGPNEKSAMPKGIGDGHYLDANTDITYLIRFQNTTKDTAYNVKVIDTISQRLDVTTLRPGEYSHEYEIDYIDDFVVQFTFPNIMLPDSASSQEGSNGYISFTISQAPDLPDGTVIPNSASIYFDFNEAIITNEVFHTIGPGYITSAPGRLEVRQGVELNIFPNPMDRSSVFELASDPFRQGTLKLFAQNGGLIREISFDQPRFELHRGDLLSGQYYFSIELDAQTVASGVLMVSK